MRPWPRARERPGLGDGGIATSLREQHESADREQRHVDRDDDSDLVRRVAQSGRDRRHGTGPLVREGRERQAFSQAADRHSLVADLVEQPPRPLGERATVEPREGLRRAEAAARSPDEQDPGQRSMRHDSV